MNSLSYSASFEDIDVSAAQDLVEIAAGAAVPITINRIEVSWGGTTQEVCRVRLVRRSDAGSGGSAVTPRALNARNTVASAATVNRNVTTPGTAGNVLWTTQQNLVVPIDELFGLDSLKVTVGGGERIGLHLVNPPAATRKCSVTVFYSE